MNVGIDFTEYSPISPAAIKSAGYSFVMGYISNTPSKDLTNPSDFVNAGLQVGLVFETTADRVLSGYAGGIVDGAISENAANNRRYPTWAPIFIAVDFPENGADANTIQQYLQGFSKNTTRPVGIYGDFWVIENFVGKGAVFGWQTVAWSSGQVSSKAHIFQRNYHTMPVPYGSSETWYDEDVMLIPLPLMGSSTPLPVPSPIARKGKKMYLFQSPSNGIWIQDNIGYHHVREMATVTEFIKAGVPLYQISDAEHTEWVTAQSVINGVPVTSAK